MSRYTDIHISEFSLSICSRSDSPHSEPGAIDEADNGTEPHTSDEGQYIIVAFHLFLWRVFVITQNASAI